MNRRVMYWRAGSQLDGCGLPEATWPRRRMEDKPPPMLERG